MKTHLLTAVRGIEHNANYANGANITNTANTTK